jgi:hypothetical protein
MTTLLIKVLSFTFLSKDPFLPLTSVPHHTYRYTHRSHLSFTKWGRKAITKPTEKSETKSQYKNLFPMKEDNSKRVHKRKEEKEKKNASTKNSIT